MSRTAWSRSSNVPSERIPPTHTSQTSRNKGKAKANDPPKSKEVLKLEGLLESLKASSSGNDPKGGCFCQARVHPLSRYTPICTQCGLVLCSLHAPHYSCPHCASSLLAPSSRDAIIEKLTAEISEVVVREREQRERAEQERQKAIGAFPTLPMPTGHPQASVIPTQTRKVLSLNAQTRKFMVASYAPSTVGTYSKESETPENRIPPPPKSVDFVGGKAAEGTRWENLRSERIYYVPPPSQNTAEGSGRGRRRKKKGEEINRS